LLYRGCIKQLSRAARATALPDFVLKGGQRDWRNCFGVIGGAGGNKDGGSCQSEKINHRRSPCSDISETHGMFVVSSFHAASMSAALAGIVGRVVWPV